MSDAYLGQIVTTPYNFTPKNWSPCAGQQLPVTQNAALYSLIGNQFGGNQTNFNLPNLMGRVAVGTGTNPQVGLTYNLGESGGLLQVPSHSHPLNSAGSAAGNTTITISGPASLSGTLQGTFTVRDAPGTSTTPAQGAAAQPFTLGKVNPSSLNIYAANNAGNAVQLSGVSVSGSVSGTLDTSANATLNLPLTGATGPVGSGKLKDSMPPYVALNQIICMNGLYPERS